LKQVQDIDLIELLSEVLLPLPLSEEPLLSHPRYKDIEDKEREAIGRIQVDEAARVLADSIRMGSAAPTPKAAMRH
jgi:hypothetical protein